METGTFLRTIAGHGCWLWITISLTGSEGIVLIYGVTVIWSTVGMTGDTGKRETGVTMITAQGMRELRVAMIIAMAGTAEGMAAEIVTADESGGFTVCDERGKSLIMLQYEIQAGASNLVNGEQQ